MASQGFEKIAAIPNLLIRIYELLTFGDQLRLSRVNQQLKYIFLNYVHTKKYRFLKIMKTPFQYFLVIGELRVNRLLLTPEELKDFVRVYAENVEEFWDFSGLTNYGDMNETPAIDVSIQQFRKLTSLWMESMLLKEEHMQFIAASCPHLRKLQLVDCSSKDGDVLLMILNSLSTKTLQQMEKLKSLRVVSVPTGVDEEVNSFKYAVLRELVAKLNLEYLDLDGILVPDLDDTAMEPHYIQHHLKELKIATSFNCDIWTNRFVSFLRNFEGLSSLTLSTEDDVTGEILDIIAKACTNLEKFQIYANFRDIKQFSMPPKVTEFSLFGCDGLTHRNLKQLLTQFRLQKFKSILVHYMGEFEDFLISPSIRVLDLDDVSTHKFPSAYVNNANLKELHWCKIENYYDDFNTWQDPGPLETCINLETLNIRNGFLPVNAILQLTHLQILHIPQTMPRLGWSYFTALLKHPTLTELHILRGFSRDLVTDLLNCSDIPTQAFPTNIKLLEIRFVLFDHGLDFWLDLLKQNPEMMLICVFFSNEYEFLKKLIWHESFPRDLRIIDICGFNIYCRDLRNNFNAVIELLERSRKCFQTPHRICHETMDHLVLSRNQ